VAPLIVGLHGFSADCLIDLSPRGLARPWIWEGEEGAVRRVVAHGFSGRQPRVDAVGLEIEKHEGALMNSCSFGSLHKV
jgi:hypothetical protein